MAASIRDACTGNFYAIGTYTEDAYTKGTCIEDACTKDTYLRGASTRDTCTESTCARSIYIKDICIGATCIAGPYAKALWVRDTCPCAGDTCIGAWGACGIGICIRSAYVNSVSAVEYSGLQLQFFET